ncbi:MAG: hypothetical protein V8R23_05815 [Alphaproteobacteria bacterium]
MTMWISKNLGGGFRIGTTIRTEPTQAELRRMAKENFVSMAKNRFAVAFLCYMMQNGYYVTNMRHLYGVDIDDEILKPINKHLERFKDVMRLLDDGGSLTEKRKEIILKSIYGIEDILKPNNELKGLYDKLCDLKPFSLGLSFLLALCSFPVLSVFKLSEPICSLLGGLICIFIFAAVIYDRVQIGKKKRKIIEEIKKKAVRIVKI